MSDVAMLRTGSWIEVTYQTNEYEKRVTLTDTMWFPSMSKGSKMIDGFTADFLAKNKDVFVLDVRTV